MIFKILWQSCCARFVKFLKRDELIHFSNSSIQAIIFTHFSTMKRTNSSADSPGKISIQVDLDERLIINKIAFQKKVFTLQEFMNLFRQQITRDVIQTFQKELSEEINQRTFVFYEMIPDEVWKKVFQYLAHQNDIFNVFLLKQVCKRWEKSFPSAIEEVTIQKAIFLEQNVKITKEIFTNIFLNLNSLNLFDASISVTQVSSKRLSQMTKLTSLSLNLGDDDDRFINNKSLPYLVNLEHLALGELDCNSFNSLKKLTRLTELDISKSHYSRVKIESNFGPNLIESLKSFKVITIDRPDEELEDFLNINTLQKRYPRVRFRWKIYELDGIYEGSFSNDNLMNGKGKIVFSDGEIFEGEFKRDKREGRGTYYYSRSLCRYEGDWKNDMREGMATFFSPYGRYEGEFKNDERNGKGTYIWRASGDRYEGEWKKGLVKGKGVMCWANGNRFQGEWKNSESCFGTMYYSNGNYYTGDFASYKKSRVGQGVMFYSNGNRYEGRFEKNKRIGKGIFHYLNGEKIEGDESKFTLNDENGTIVLL